MSEDVELCLEVQVDPASKKILSNPERCRSALLDVTVVKPKEIEAFGTQTTNTLRADEVRKLLTSLEKQRRKKQKVLDQLKYDDTIIKIRKHQSSANYRRVRKPFTKQKERIGSNSPIDNLERKDFIGIAESVEPLFCEIKRSLKNVETRITNMQDINLVISETTADESGVNEIPYSTYKSRNPLTNPNALRNQSVYRVETAPHDLKSVLLSDNKQKLLERGDKIEAKCLCENCGIVGLLTECQKHPLLTELSESPAPSNHRQGLNSRKRTRFNISNCDNWKTKSLQGTTYINQLTDRVKLLEQRLAMQEERVVPRDYFKKIITKMVSNFSSKKFKSKSESSMHCVEKNIKQDLKNEKHSPHSSRVHHCRSADRLDCCDGCTHHKPTKKKDQWTTTDDDVYPGASFWKWGEEILKPGIDLKNKIINLLNEILSRFSLAQTAQNTSVKKSEDYHSETFKKFAKDINTKVYNAQVDTRPNYYGKREHVVHFEPFYMNTGSEYSKNSCEDKSEKTKPLSSPKSSEKTDKNVDVSYVNPKLTLWRTESPDKVIGEISNQKGKQEFLKICSKAKQHQKDILWKNIWNQAKANGQTKNDNITIKIPSQTKDSKGKQKIFETEITIGEVEKILKGVKTTLM